MASGTGTAVLDFGTGANEASVVITEQGSITALSKTDAFVMGDDTTGSHTAKDHRYFAALAGLTCGTPSAGAGFTIYATSMHRLQGTYQVRWVWAE